MKKILVLLVSFIIGVNAFALIGNEKTFGEKLIKGEKYVMSFKHPFTGEEMKRTIKGKINGKIVFEEEMPNNGLMIVRVNESQTKVVADFYNGDGNMDGSKKYNLDGKMVTNVLQELMNNGQVEFKGYE